MKKLYIVSGNGTIQRRSRRTIGILQGTHISKVNCCLNVHNVHLKWTNFTNSGSAGGYIMCKTLCAINFLVFKLDDDHNGVGISDPWEKDSDGDGIPDYLDDDDDNDGYP